MFLLAVVVVWVAWPLEKLANLVFEVLCLVALALGGIADVFDRKGGA